MKRKAIDVLLSLYNSICKTEDVTPGYPPMPMSEAQKALCEDLLAALPEKAAGLKNFSENDKKRMNEIELHIVASRSQGFNQAIDQMEQAIRSYFGQTKGKG